MPVSLNFLPVLWIKSYLQLPIVLFYIPGVSFFAHSAPIFGEYGVVATEHKIQRDGPSGRYFVIYF